MVNGELSSGEVVRYEDRDGTVMELEKEKESKDSTYELRPEISMIRFLQVL